MTGNKDSDRVGRTGAGNGTGGLRLADRLRNVAIGARLSGRDSAKGGPYVPLKSGGLHIQGDVNRRFMPMQSVQQQRHPWLESLLIPYQRGLWVLLEEISIHGLFGSTKANGCDPTFCGGNQHVSEICIHDGISHLYTPAPLTIDARRHTKLGGCPRVHATTRLIASIVKRTRHGGSLLKPCLE